MSDRLLAIGSYTSEPAGHGSGVTLCAFDEVSGQLSTLATLALASPSWLQWHPTLPVLYAANEVDAGTVSVIDVQAGGAGGAAGVGLRLRGSVSSGGSQPCHLAITPDGRRLYAANYGSGSLAAFDLAADGAITGPAGLSQHRGSGPDPDRQQGPHVHMVVLAEDADTGGGLVSGVDLGTDQIRSYRPSGNELSTVAVTNLPAGCGPRQLVRSPMPDRAYLVAELSAQLLTLDEIEPGSFQVVDAVAASGLLDQAGRSRRNLPAQLSLSAEGDLGYLSNRYPDSISVFDLTGPSPVPVAEFEVGPGWPRHFALIGGWLINANQHGDQVVGYALSAGGRQLSEVSRHPVGSPTCVAVGPGHHQVG